MSIKSYGSSSEDEDSSSVYTDDFDTDSPISTPEKHLKSHSNKKNLHSKKSNHGSTGSGTTFHSQKKTFNHNSKMKKVYTPRPSGGSLRKTSGALKSTKKSSNVAKQDLVQTQMLSVQKSRINTLNNELVELQGKLDELVKENRFLKKIQHRHEKSLQKFENKDADIPRLISNYEEEIRVLKIRLRKSQEAERNLESKLRDNNDEIQKTEQSLQRLKKLVDDKNLAERSELFKQLNAAQDRLYDCEKKNSDLKKKLDLTIQSFTRQVNGEKSKHVETKEKLKELQQENNFLESRLKEKERALQVSNIYALRAKPAVDRTPVSSGRSSSGKASKKNGREKNTNHLKSTSPPSPPLCSTSNDQTDVLSRADLHAMKDKSNDSGNFGSPSASPVTDVRDEARSSVKADDKKVGELSNGLNDLNLFKEVEVLRSINKDDEKDSRSFLSSNKPNDSTFTTKSQSSSNCSSASSTKEQTNFIRQKSFTIHSKPMEMAAVEEKQIDEERKKAALLAKIRNLDASDNIPNPTPEDQQIRKLLQDDLTSQSPYSRRVETKKPFYEAGDAGSGFSSNTNLINNQPDTDVDELTFGGYAPTVTSAPKRKLNPRSTTLLATPPSLDADEPLLDLNSGKTKNNDLLQQLFGADIKTNASTNGHIKKESYFSANRRMTSPKATALVPPLQNGFSRKDTQRNGSHAGLSHPRKGSIMGSPLIKAFNSTADDEIEEIIM